MSATMQPFQNLWLFIWFFLKSYKLYVYFFCLLAIVTGFWAPLSNVLIKTLINTLNTMDNQSSRDVFQNFPMSIFGLAVLFVLNFELHNLCWRGLSYLNYRYKPIIKNRIISETLEYVLSASQQFFQNNLAGRIASQINILADNIEYIVSDISKQLIRGLALLFVAFVSMYLVHSVFFYALFTWLVIFAYFSLTMSKRLINLSESHAYSESVVSGNLVDTITNVNNVRLFARRSYEVSYLANFLRLTKEAFQKKELYSIKLHLFQGFSLSAMLAFMLYFLIRLYNTHQVTLGDFALILGLGVEVGFMSWWTLEQMDELNVAIGKCKQSLASLFLPLGIKDKEKASILQVNHGEIVFSKVHFYYKDTGLLFHNKSVTIPAGQKVGLVGYSGSGKSTFVNLILRLYDVVEGKILIDGQDIRNVTQDSLRSNIAMISQDPSLFHRTLIENIRYGNLAASDEEIMKAAKRAYADEFISKLPEGYQSLVGERGIKLSGGQRQRIAIARAILKNAPILILDEATSQLDSVTERYIQESLWNLMRDKTSIVIAHRLSTLLYMDRILVFHQGKIIEDGTHDDLIKLRGLYKKFWDTQVDGFLPFKYTMPTFTEDSVSIS